MPDPQLVSCYVVGSSSRNQLHLSLSLIFFTKLSKASKTCCEHHLFGNERNTPQSSVPEQKPRPKKKDSWFHKANIFHVEKKRVWSGLFVYFQYRLDSKRSVEVSAYRFSFAKKRREPESCLRFFSVPFNPLLFFFSFFPFLSFSFLQNDVVVFSFPSVPSCAHGVVERIVKQTLV